jgi:hypothetical protein
VAGPGLKHLAALPALRDLELSSTKVTNASILALGASDSLRDVRFFGTKVTREGAKQLQERLLKCTVRTDY